MYSLFNQPMVTARNNLRFVLLFPSLGQPLTESLSQATSPSQSSGREKLVCNLPIFDKS